MALNASCEAQKGFVPLCHLPQYLGSTHTTKGKDGGFRQGNTNLLSVGQKEQVLPCPQSHLGPAASLGVPKSPTHGEEEVERLHCKPSADFGALVLPEGDLAVVAARRQQPRLLGVPGDAVDVLRVRAGDVGGQREGGLVRVGGRALLEHADGVVPAGRGQSPGEVAPGGDTALG